MLDVLIGGGCDEYHQRCSGDRLRAASPRGLIEDRDRLLGPILPGQERGQSQHSLRLIGFAGNQRLVRRLGFSDEAEALEQVGDDTDLVGGLTAPGLEQAQQFGSTSPKVEQAGFPLQEAQGLRCHLLQLGQPVVRLRRALCG